LGGAARKNRALSPLARILPPAIDLQVPAMQTATFLTGPPPATTTSPLMVKTLASRSMLGRLSRICMIPWQSERPDQPEGSGAGEPSGAGPRSAGGRAVGEGMGLRGGVTVDLGATTGPGAGVGVAVGRRVALGGGGLVGGGGGASVPVGSSRPRAVGAKVPASILVLPGGGDTPK